MYEADKGGVYEVFMSTVARRLCLYLLFHLSSGRKIYKILNKMLIEVADFWLEET